jgi:hypothetical protein
MRNSYNILNEICEQKRLNKRPVLSSRAEWIYGISRTEIMTLQCWSNRHVVPRLKRPDVSSVLKVSVWNVWTSYNVTYSYVNHEELFLEHNSVQGDECQSTFWFKKISLFSSED